MKTLLTTVSLGAITAGAASAAEITISSDITTSTTWTNDNTYKLDGQIYVRAGATLTIEPGTVIASDVADEGSLAVSRGAQIFALGEAGRPIIFTSDRDVATWDPLPSHPTGRNPKTGVWRESNNEWGNLTIMGRAYISEDAIPGNVPTPNASNVANMEGLQPGPGQDGQYGGGLDDDDSGTLRHVSFRYGGRVIGLANELNGLSLGGIGSGTDIDYIEIMNNVDDGVEIWGGTVNLRHVSIWNIGDDSLDIDQGWRGKCQYLLIVQGFSDDADQGSGVGDNCVEHDGAENCDWQPRTRGQIANATLIGQPLAGDGATAWRDNCGMQYYNSIIMDCGEAVVRFDDDDGDGACGYSAVNGTLSWAEHWTTGAAQFPLVNEAGNPGFFYNAQRLNDRVADIEDTVFFRNLNIAAYTEANARGVFAASNNNLITNAPPIASITRGPLEVKGGLNMVRVIALDPRPINDAVNSASPVIADGFFEPALFRGAFSPNTKGTWLCGWTASDAYGFTTGDCIGENLTDSNANSIGQIGQLRAYGSDVASDNDVCLEASGLPRSTFGFFINADDFGFIANPGGSQGNILLGGSPLGRFQQNIANSGSAGVFSLQLDLNAIPRPGQPLGLLQVMAGDSVAFQTWHRDSSSGTATSNFSNAVRIDFN
ncbi:MAG: hypothetical protein AAF726_23305 [Planctomycetota bacterium]